MLNQALVLLRLMFTLLLPRGENDVLFRWELAQTIATATDNAEEQFTLVRLARYESGFRRNVARCDTHAKADMVTEDHGKSFGAFQIQPMTPADRKKVCGSLPDQVDVALRYIRRSSEVCPKNEGAAKLHLYVSGRCDYGHHEAELRWGGQDLLPVSATTE